MCIASHSSAEPDTPGVMDCPDRGALIEEESDVSYLKEHYLTYPCVLVRISRVGNDALHDLVVGVDCLISAKTRRKAGGSSRRGARRR